MISSRQGTDPRARWTIIAACGGALLALLLLGHPVQATHEIVVLDGTLDADDFLIASDPEEPTRLLLCDDVCFSRSRAEVGTIVVNGFDGDDTVTVGHGDAMATNVDGALDISFNGGPGVDRLEICAPPLPEPCSATIDTTVVPGASNDERVLTQQATSGPNVGDTVTLTLNDVATIRDESAGAVTVEAGAVADDLTMREVAGDPGTGVVTVNTAAPYRFRNKSSVLLDTGTGADRVTLAEVAGLGGGTPGNCAPSTAPAAPVCVRGDATADDTVVAAGATSVADEVHLTPRAAGASSMAGLSTLGPVDLLGIDTVRVTLQSSEDDSLDLTTTSFGDVLRTDTTTDGVLLTGDLSVDDAPFAMPTVEVIGDGSAPLRVSWDAGEGADELSLSTTVADDTVTVDDACGTSACVTTSPDGLAGHRVALTDVERHRVEAGSGDDRLVALADRAADTAWRGGEGADTALVRGTGPDVTLDFGTSTVRQDAAGAITTTATEQLDLDVAGGSLHTRSTAADDALVVRPVTSQSARIELAGHPTSVHATAVAGTNVLETGDGRDEVEVVGTTNDDRFAVGRGPDLGVQVDALLPVRISGAEAAVLTGMEGDDRFDITGAEGPETLTVDGGPDAGTDLVTFAAATTDVAVSVDDDLGTGQLDADGPPVGLQGIEKVDVEGDGEDTLTVAGSDAADTITQQANTVTVGRTTDVAFSGFPTLALAGGPAGDQLWVAPATTVGVTGITAGGGAEADSLTVLGTVLSETITHTPHASDGGVVEVGTAPPVTFDAIEATNVHGATAPPSGDTLVVDTPHHDGTLRLEPGAAFDGGTVRFLDVDGVSTTASPVHFGALGRGEVEFAGDPALPHDRVVLAGQSDDDVVVLATRSGPSGEEAVVTLDQQVPVAVPGARTLVLDGGAGTDTFRLPTDHPIPGDAGPGIEVRAGSPDTDRLDLTAGDGELVAATAADHVSEAGHAAIRHTAVEHIDLDANTNALTVLGGDGPDALGWGPTGPAAGDVTATESPTLAVSELGSLTFDPVDGADTVTVATRSVADDVTVARAPTTEVSVAGLQSLLLPASVESLAVKAGDGADTVQVVGDGGPAALAVDGGAPSADGDVLRLVSRDAAVAHAPEPSAGRVDSPGGPIVFSTMETIDVVGDGTGGLTVHGTGAAEALTIGDTATPSVRVDEGADVTYAGYPQVTLDGRGGGDAVTVGLAGMGDVDGLHVDGGPGLDDTISLVDATGASRTFTVRPVTATTGSFEATGHRTTLTIAGTETSTLDGRGGDDTVTVVTPGGAQEVRVAPGASADAGTVEVGSLVPLAFQQVGAGGHLIVTDAASDRVDTLTVAGTSASDTTVVDGPVGVVRRDGWVTLRPASALDLALPGGDGDDEVALTGPLPYRTTTVDGGGPDLGDGLRLQGTAGDVTVDLAAATVTGYGGVVAFPAVADLHTDVGGVALTQRGSARDDALCYDPMAPRDGRLYIVGAPGGGTASSTCLPDQRGTNVLHTFVDVARLTVDPAAGEDEVIVNGSTSRDLLTVNAQAPTTEVTVHPQPDSGSSFRLPVNVVTSTTESLVVAADTGADSIDVTTYDTRPTPVITIHGEGPSTRHDADEMVVRDGTGGAHLHDAGSHTKGSGTVTAEYRKGSGAIVRVDYVDVEKVTLLRDPKAGD